MRAVAFRGDGILLVKEPEDGLWTPPGGWAGVGESAAEAAVRETREESGYEVRAIRLIAPYDRDRHGHPPIPYHGYEAVFLCKVLPEEPAPEWTPPGSGSSQERPFHGPPGWLRD